MFEKNMKLAYLLDFYADALDEHTRTIMSAYYCDDLSLAEIADGEGISRQGIRHVIKRGEEQLEFFEEKLGLAARHEQLSLAVESLCSVKSSLISKGLSNECELIQKAIETIVGKGG
jgi:predicted DNA-binding protein YlxM (UPF0122 family)